MTSDRRNAALGLAAASALIAAASDIGRLIRESIIVKTIAEVPVKVIAHQRETEIPADVSTAVQVYSQATSGQEGQR